MHGDGMDFFAQQARARRQTRLLIVYFILSVAVVVALIYLLLASLVLTYRESPAYPSSLLNLVVPLFDLLARALSAPFACMKWVWRPPLFLSIASWTLLGISLGSLYKIRCLSQGGAVVAELLGGRRVESNPNDLEEQRLRHVVEEMSIASGTPVPEIYVLDNERGINTFAAGHTHSDIAIGVTRGCLKLLDRDELQGVIAHEFSHVLNGDTRLNMRLMGVVHGILWPVIFGRVLIRGTHRPAEPGESIFDQEASVLRSPLLPIGFGFICLGSLGLPFVRLTKSAICREREWLADAEAVQFTRFPAGIAGALKKVGGLSKRGRLDATHAETASHLYFVNSSSVPFFHFQSTHPPLGKRILAIDPAFDGQFPRVAMLPPTQFERDRMYEDAVMQALALEKAHPDAVVSGAGNLTVEHLRAASAIRLGLPENISRAVHEPAGAMAVIYTLLLACDETTQCAQLEILRTKANENVCKKTLDLLAETKTIGDHVKLPVIDLALPALRHLGHQHYEEFARTVQELIEADRAIDLFEYTLQKILFRHLRPYYEKVRPPAVDYATLHSVLTECAILLSALAQMDEDNPAQARAAFRNGVKLLDVPADELHLLSREACNLPQVDVALDRLARAAWPLKRKILLACAHTVATDRRVAPREAELLRAIADALGFPIPPFVQAIEFCKKGRP